MRRYLWVSVAASLLSLLLFWTPFWLNANSIWQISLPEPSLKTIIANYDGMNFLVVARSWYDPEIIRTEYSQLVGERGERYFAAHYPVYAVVIWFFDLFTTGDNAILLSIIFSNILLSTLLYYFFTNFLKNQKLALALSLLSLFWPARMLSVRSVGSNEPIFIALILSSLVAYSKNMHWRASVLGSLGVLTRSPGILLFASYFLTIAMSKMSLKDKVKSITPYLLMPVSLLLLWGYFGIAYGDPLAYFKVGGNINLSIPPFLAFGSNMDWVSGSWLEDIVFTYAYYLLGILLLWDKTHEKAELSVVVNFGLIYMLATWFIVHRDIARYSLPLVPIALLGIGYKITWSKKWLLMLILLIPIYLAGWKFVASNMAPIADWTPFL